MKIAIRVFLFLWIAFSGQLEAFSYIKGGATVVGEKVVAPSAGIGQRWRIFSIAALDFSWSLAAAKERKVGMYTSPRIAALVYINPWNENRLYVGAAGSWAFIVDAQKKHGFSGVLADAIAGIEFQSIYFVHPFIEVSQAFPCSKFSSRIGRIGKNPSTTIMLGLGI